jgi:long-chain acyl-CoA synthetase
VIGRSSAGDEEVIAFVQPLPNVRLAASDIVEHAARHLATYKRPSQIHIVSTMPVTPTGKIIKADLAKTLEHSSVAIAVTS